MIKKLIRFLEEIRIYIIGAGRDDKMGYRPMGQR